MPRVGAAPERVHGRVLGEQHIRPAGQAAGDQLPLPYLGRLVVDPAGQTHLEHCVASSTHVLIALPSAASAASRSASDIVGWACTVPITSAVVLSRVRPSP